MMAMSARERRWAAPSAGTGTTGVCTGQFQQTTPAITAGGPFSFVAYRAITVPGFDVFGRVPGMSVCHIRGNAFDSCTGTPNTGGR
jgi:hypothetical protein